MIIQGKNKMLKRLNKKIILSVFLLSELVLYILILTTGGSFLSFCCYTSIVICFLYALTNFSRRNALVIAALACTLGADFCLVVMSPQEKLYGMIFFLAVQLIYAIKLNRETRSCKLLLARVILTLTAITAVLIVLKERSDALAVISLAYYVNLAVNIIESFTQFKKNMLFSIGLVFFLLCDTVIGLQTAAGAYMPIAENSVLYKIIFMDFFLSWFFYLPSQVLIALSTNSKTPA